MNIALLLFYLMFISYYIFSLYYSIMITFGDEYEYTVKRQIFLWILCFIGCIILTPLHLADALANRFK